jgi:hypothetical protein
MAARARVRTTKRIAESTEGAEFRGVDQGVGTSPHSGHGLVGLIPARS